MGPRARNALIVVIGGAIGAALIVAAQHYRADLEAWVREDLRTRVRLMIAALTLFTSGPLLAMAIYCWRAARTGGPILRFVAIFSGGSGLLLAWLLWRFLLILERSAATP